VPERMIPVAMEHAFDSADADERLRTNGPVRPMPMTCRGRTRVSGRESR
jgi:hypothetical protein